MAALSRDPPPLKNGENETELINEMVKNALLNFHITPKPKNNALKIKCEYKGEKRCFEMDRPVVWKALQAHLIEKVGKGQKLNIYYTQGKAEVVVAIKSQEELDRAVKIVDAASQRCLRLLLSKHETGSDSHIQKPDASGTYSACVIESVPYSETCSSCGASQVSMSRSIGGASSCSSGVQLDSDDWRFSAPSPRAPSNWKEGRCIGKGAFGDVHVAYDTDSGRDLAVKKIPLSREAGSDAEGLEYDVRELGRLQHPRIVQYLGVQKSSDCIRIFMEYMSNGSVKDLISANGPLSSRVARRYTGQVLEGLSFLHKNHIIHRDIKSANLLRDSEGNVKIADFGSGKKMQTLASHRGDYNGTIHYTAPEVLLGKSAYGRKADIWSVGVTLVEMLTGTVPWHELEPMAAMIKIVYEEPSIVVPPMVDQRVVDLARHLMKKSQDERPMAAEVLANHPAFKETSR